MSLSGAQMSFNRSGRGSAAEPQPRITTRHKNTDHTIRALSNSSAAMPARELPTAFNSGDRTQTVNCPGTLAAAIHSQRAVAEIGAKHDLDFFVKVAE